MNCFASQQQERQCERRAREVTAGAGRNYTGHFPQPDGTERFGGRVSRPSPRVMNEVRTRRPASLPSAPRLHRGDRNPGLLFRMGEGALYRIQQAETTLLVVAGVLGVTLQQVLDANPGVNPNRLQIGHRRLSSQRPTN